MNDDRPMDQRIAEMLDDPAVGLTVDGSGVGGLLAAAFGADVTAMPEQCAHCGTVSVIATMRAYVRGPGIVIRCPACTDIVIRIVDTPTGTRIDVGGATRLRGPGPAG